MGKQKRQSTRAYPPAPSGNPKPSFQGYPVPQTGGHQLGLNNTSHNGSNYPQPNSANQPDSGSMAGPGAVPGPAAYRPNLAGNSVKPSVDTELSLVHGDAPPDYPGGS